jgi:NAD(P)-dependent dehydrogenase (short-subunit alcohol dehydrogenase family)
LIDLASTRFKGRRVIVTGGGSGIGKATAEAFLREGGKVAIFDISQKGGGQVVSELKKKGYEPLLFVGDVSKASDVRRMVKGAVAKMGGIDVLFNNAGILVEGTVEKVSEKDWDRIMAVNVKGVFLMSK